jgi:hypothetical protein
MFPEFLEYTDAIGISNGTLILPIGCSPHMPRLHRDSPQRLRWDSPQRLRRD